MSTAEYRETAPPISRLGTGADTAPGAFLLLSAYPRRCRMLASPMSTQTALCTILSMMASACTPPPSLGCQFFFLSCVQKTVEAVPYLSSISSSSIDLNYVSGLSSSHSPPSWPPVRSGRCASRRGRCGRSRSAADRSSTSASGPPWPYPSRHLEPPRSLDCMAARA